MVRIFKRKVTEKTDQEPSNQASSVQNTRSEAIQTLNPYRDLAITSKRSSELQRAIEILKLDLGFSEALDTQNFFGLIKPGETSPTFDEILRAFTPEMLKVAEHFLDPEFILIPPNCSFNDMLAAIDYYIKEVPYRDQDHFFNLPANHNSKIEQWQAYIIDTPRTIDPKSLIKYFNDSNIKITLWHQMEFFENYKKQAGVGGMERCKFIQLLMQGLKERNEDNIRYIKYGKKAEAGVNMSDYSTVFDEENDPYYSGSYVPIGSWERYGARFFFGAGNLRSDYLKDFRYRCSVGGKVPY